MSMGVSSHDTRSLGGLFLVLSLAASLLLGHILTGGQYGFHRDELATLDDARHLAWGYVAYPPVTPFFGWLSLQFFGTSLTGFRFFAALAASAGIVLTGLIARELGGGRGAMMLAALAAMPFALACGSLMQYVAFDYLCWIAIAYFFARLCQSNDPRWWLPLGAIIGIGMLTKYSLLFCIAGVVVGVTATRLRSHLRMKWLWLGAGLSLLIFLPNLIWQAQHHFISLEFLRHIHARDVRIGRTKDFLPDQFNLNLGGLLLALAGLAFYFFSAKAKQWRPLGWLYLVPFVLFFLSQGRGYYLAPAYPLLFAGGAVWSEKIASQWRSSVRRSAYITVALVLLVGSALFGAVVLPNAPIHSAWWRFAISQNGDLVEEIGWPELVETIARVRDNLSPTDRQHLGILAGNYGEAGAINLYGPQHGLPSAISGTNSFWSRGYGNPPPEVLIVVGFDRDFVDHYFHSAELVAHTFNRANVANEETTDHPDIFLCRGLNLPWPEFWKNFQRFG
jgi:4-amino-4-deoxy-L-arabinose transferase-like glycosyltransferase